MVYLKKKEKGVRSIIFKLNFVLTKKTMITKNIVDFNLKNKII